MNERVDDRRESSFSMEPYLLQIAGRSIRYGIGCALLGRVELGSERERDLDTLNAAYEGGFRYFDTSAAYGESETVLGHWLPTIERGSIFLASKSKVDEDASPREAREKFLRSLERSLERLNVDYLDLIQVHDVDGLTQVLNDDGILPALLECKRRGIVRGIGLATRSLELLGQAVEHGGFDTVLTYQDFTPIDDCARGLIGSADRRGVKAINASPLHYGLLRGPDPRSLPDYGLKVRHADAVSLYDWCNARGVSLRSLALQYPLRNPEVSMTLSGPTCAEQIASALQSLADPLPESLWAELSVWEAQRRSLRAGAAVQQGGEAG